MCISTSEKILSDKTKCFFEVTFQNWCKIFTANYYYKNSCTHTACHRSETLCANPVTFEEQNHKEMGETCIFLDSCQAWCSPRGSPSPHGSASPHRPPSWQTIPKGMLLRHWGCFHTSKVLAQLSPGCKWKEWQDFYCWESLNWTGSGWVVLGDPTQLLQQLGQTWSFHRDRRRQLQPALPGLRLLVKMGAEVKQNSGFLLRIVMEGG